MIYEWKDNEYKRLSPEGGIEATQSIGTIALWMLPKLTIPHGWLLCDGSQFDRDKYPKLYELSGDDHTPDLTGEQVLLGTTLLARLNQVDNHGSMPNVTGTTGRNPVRSSYPKVGTGIFRVGNSGSTDSNSGGTDSHSTYYFNSSYSNKVYVTGADRVMPKTIEAFYIIKALDTQPIYEWIEDNVKIEM